MEVFQEDFLEKFNNMHVYMCITVSQANMKTHRTHSHRQLAN